MRPPSRGAVWARAAAAAQQAAHTNWTLLAAVVPHVLTAGAAQVVTSGGVVAPTVAVSAAVRAHSLGRSLCPLAAILLLPLPASGGGTCLSGGAASATALLPRHRLGAAAWQRRWCLFLPQHQLLLLPLHRPCYAAACCPSRWGSDPWPLPGANAPPRGCQCMAGAAALLAVGLPVGGFAGHA